MITFLFWNLGRYVLGNLLASIAQHNGADVILLTECQETATDILLALNRGDVSEYYYAPGYGGCERIQVFTRFPDHFIPPVAEAPRSSIRRLALPGLTEILVAVAHLPSKRDSDPDSQIGDCIELAKQIRMTEDDSGHARTVLVGDLNVNPFETGMLLANGLHSVMCRSIAQKRHRSIRGQPYPFFYNPMWSLFGDFSPGPPGTYYYGASRQSEFFWYMFDQVLIRPDLLDRFRNESLQIVTSVGHLSLLSRSGQPDTKVGSDHLPLVFSLAL